MLNLRQLQYLQLLIETGSFAGAAQQAHITQPALSNAIRGLEERVGMQLIDRSERPVRITSGGRDFYARINSLLREARNLEKEITYLAQGIVGYLNIGMTAVVSTSYGGIILGTWQNENPGMSVDVTIAHNPTLVEMLRAEQLDLVIGDPRELQGFTADLDMTPIPSQPGGAFCRAGHPLLDGRNVNFTDLLPYRFAGSHLPVHLLKLAAPKFGLNSYKEIDFALNCDNISVLKDAVMHSDLILLTALSCVRNEIKSGLIKELPVKFNLDAMWSYMTLNNAVAHPAIPSLCKTIETTLSLI